MKPTSLLAALWLALFLSPLVTMAKKGGDICAEKEKHHYGSLKELKKKLNLTEAQQNSLKEMQASYGKEAMKKKHTEMEKAQKDLAEALKSDLADEKVREKYETLAKLQEDFAKTRFEKILHIRSVLTPEQRAKFKDLIGKE